MQCFLNILSDRVRVRFFDRNFDLDRISGLNIVVPHPDRAARDDHAVSDSCGLTAPHPAVYARSQAVTVKRVPNFCEIERKVNDDFSAGALKFCRKGHGLHDLS